MTDALKSDPGSPRRLAELRHIGYEFEHAAQRAGAVQRSLRSAQNFDPGNVEWVEIRREELIADWKLAVNGEEVFKIDPLK